METEEEINFLLKHRSVWNKKTPCFVVNNRKLEKNINIVKNLLKGEIAYSHKTNPEPCVVKHILKNGCSLLISSVEELDTLRQSLEIQTNNIIFQSPSLTQKQYRKIRNIGIHRFSIDSLDQLDIVLKDIKKNGAQLELIVRVNTGTKIEKPELAYGMETFLGFPLAEAEQVLVKLNSLKKRGVKKIGIHNHLLSQNKDLGIWKKNLESLVIFLNKLRKRGIMIDSVDFGGGYPVQYNNDVPSLEELSKIINQYLAKILEIFPSACFIFEPGRILVADAVTLVAKVVHTKNFLDKKIAILNCSLYNSSLDTLIVGLYLPVKKIQKQEKGKKCKYIIRGSTPDSLDVFAKNVELPVLRNKNFVAFLKCGAYSFGSDFVSLEKVKYIEI